MDGLEEKMNAVLSNPQMMQQIMTMAQALGSQNAPRQEPKQESQRIAQALPDIDLGMLQKISGAMGQSGPDRNQQALLKALGPYLSQDRIGRLERAMRAAKMAKLAGSFLGPGGLLTQSGR